MEDKITYLLEGIALALVAIIALSMGQELAISLSKGLHIPYDLALTSMSIGFGNSVVVLSIVFAVGFTFYLFERIIPAIVEYIVWH